MTDRDIWFADLEAFLHETGKLNDFDYGDFMRQVNFSLETLLERLESLNLRDKDWYREKLLEIQDYVQFYPDWDVEQTRPRLFADLKILWDHAKVAAGVVDSDVEPFPPDLLLRP